MKSIVFKASILGVSLFLAHGFFSPGYSSGFPEVEIAPGFLKRSGARASKKKKSRPQQRSAFTFSQNEQTLTEGEVYAFFGLPSSSSPKEQEFELDGEGIQGFFSSLDISPPKRERADQRNPRSRNRARQQMAPSSQFNREELDPNLSYGPKFTTYGITHYNTRFFLMMDGGQPPQSRGLYHKGAGIYDKESPFPNTLVIHPYHFRLDFYAQYFPFMARKGSHQFTIQYIIPSDKSCVQSFRPHHCAANGNKTLTYKFWHKGDPLERTLSGQVNTHPGGGVQIASPNNFHLPSALKFCGSEGFVLSRVNLEGTTHWILLISHPNVFKGRLDIFRFPSVRSGLQLSHMVYFLRHTLKGVPNDGIKEFFDGMSDAFKK